MLTNPRSAVFGLIGVATLLAAEGAGRETYLKTVGAVAIALVTYWIAHAYAELTARRLRDQEHLTAGRLGDALVHEAPLLASGALPLIPVLGFWAGGAPLEHALTAGFWTAAALIVVVELIAAWRADLRGMDFAKEAVLGGALGLLTVALRAVLH